MFCFHAFSAIPFLAATFVAAPLDAATLVPDAVKPSSLTIKLTNPVQVVAPSNGNNVASPVVINGAVYVIDQKAASVTLIDGTPILSGSTLPTGVTPEARRGILNIAGQGDTAYVAYSSTALPADFAGAAPLPDQDPYNLRDVRYDLIYKYSVGDDGSLSDPVPVTAFESQDRGHRGEGMLILPDGSLLFARGDQLSQNFNGLAAPQDPASTVGKLLRIDGDTGDVQVVASGLRNVQHLAYEDADRQTVVFSDIGWQVAEEINRIATGDLVDTSKIENFGWGVGADGLAREGTFYVNDGPESVAQAIGMAVLGEPGFEQPFAQFGREESTGFFAVSGPVASEASFDRIGLLFGDLASGGLYATLNGADGIVNDVFEVGVLAEDGTVTDLPGFLGGGRDDMRFFNFPDLTAGVLFERSGVIYQITEVAMTPVPIAGSGLLLLCGLGGFAGLRRRPGAK